MTTVGIVSLLISGVSAFKVYKINYNTCTICISNPVWYVVSDVSSRVPVRDLVLHIDIARVGEGSCVEKPLEFLHVQCKATFVSVAVSQRL